MKISAKQYLQQVRILDECITKDIEQLEAMRSNAIGQERSRIANESKKVCALMMALKEMEAKNG